MKRRGLTLLILIFQVILNLNASTLDKEKHFNLNNLDIIGTSNISQFKLNLESGLANQYDFYRNSDSIYSLNIPIKSLKSSNILMLHDFRRLVKASEFPTINLIINSLQVDSFIANEYKGEIDVNIEIAGKKHLYKILMYKACLDDSRSYIVGRGIIKLSDFNLKASRIKGLITVENEVLINFKINFETTLNN